MRHKLAKLYLEDGQLVWNGNAVKGSTNIQKFFEDLPTSVHNILCVDAQNINGMYKVIFYLPYVIVKTLYFYPFLIQYSPQSLV